MKTELELLLCQAPPGHTEIPCGLLSYYTHCVQGRDAALHHGVVFALLRWAVQSFYFQAPINKAEAAEEHCSKHQVFLASGFPKSRVWVLQVHLWFCLWHRDGVFASRCWEPAPGSTWLIPGSPPGSEEASPGAGNWFFPLCFHCPVQL